MVCVWPLVTHSVDSWWSLKRWLIAPTYPRNTSLLTRLSYVWCSDCVWWISICHWEFLVFCEHRGRPGQSHLCYFTCLYSSSTLSTPLSIDVYINTLPAYAYDGPGSYHRDGRWWTMVMHFMCKNHICMCVLLNTPLHLHFIQILHEFHSWYISDWCYAVMTVYCVCHGDCATIGT